MFHLNAKGQPTFWDGSQSNPHHSHNRSDDGLLLHGKEPGDSHIDTVITLDWM